VPDVESSEETVGFKALPLHTIFITERRYILAKYVAKKTKLESFMKCIRSYDYFFIGLKEQNLAPFRVSKELQHRQNACDNRTGRNQYKQHLQPRGSLRKVADNTGNDYGGKSDRQDKQHAIACDFIPLLYNHSKSLPQGALSNMR